MFNLLRQALTSRTGASTIHYDDSDGLQLRTRSSYKHHKKTALGFTVTVMNHHVQDAGERKTNGAGSKNTGFPEPFSEDRNTTLPHPDADTSPNATIEAPDDLTRTHSRSSFLHRNGRHHSGHHLFGRHDSLDKMYANITYADDDACKDHPEGPGPGDVDGKGEGNGLGVNGVAESRPQSQGSQGSQGEKGGEKKKGILKKLAVRK
ncbi:uncharacterized protein PAC_18272 [Phialocephala subalpina]|uniref:Uncharacterized protein n=1 Tax=Phialocephala subalpina TaxID=576137 RepID=A0A1L7XTK0_9HELO|nr:uncharacterized protein PAC_18272 [Phialocephala subalpina]